MLDGLEGVTDDALLDGRVRLLQPRRGHRAGSDAVLLAAVQVPASGTIIDLGSGSGAVGLMIAARAEALEVLFVERGPMLADLCRRNIALNGLEGRARVVEADILAPARARREAGLHPASADLVVTNPPFLEAGRSRPSPDALRAAAHQLPEGGLETWLRVCADLLKASGRVALIHRADRLYDCLGSLERGFGGIVIRPIHPRADEPASRIVITALKGSRAPLRIAPPLVLHEADGAFTPEATALHDGTAMLRM
jgi:tRNA1(Val) A37 N6-methylase TrmN6